MNNQKINDFLRTLKLKVEENKKMLEKRQLVIKEFTELTQLLKKLREKIDELKLAYSIHPKESLKKEIDEYTKQENDYIELINEYATEINELRNSNNYQKDKDFLEMAEEFYRVNTRLKEIEKASKKLKTKESSYQNIQQVIDSYGRKKYIHSSMINEYKSLLEIARVVFPLYNKGYHEYIDRYDIKEQTVENKIYYNNERLGISPNYIPNEEEYNRMSNQDKIALEQQFYNDMTLEEKISYYENLLKRIKTAKNSGKKEHITIDGEKYYVPVKMKSLFINYYKTLATLKESKTKVEEPILVDKNEEPVVEEVVEQPVIAEPVEKPIFANIDEEPVVEEVIEQPVIAEPVEKPIFENMNEEPVVEGEVVEQPVIAEPVEKPIFVNIDEEPVVEEVIEQPVIAEPVEKPIFVNIDEEPVVEGEVVEQPVIAEPVEYPIFVNIDEEPVVEEVIEQPVVAEPVEKPIFVNIDEEPVVEEVVEQPVIAESNDEIIYNTGYNNQESDDEIIYYSGNEGDYQVVKTRKPKNRKGIMKKIIAASLALVAGLTIVKGIKSLFNKQTTDIVSTDTVISAFDKTKKVNANNIIDINNDNVINRINNHNNKSNNQNNSNNLNQDNINNTTNDNIIKIDDKVTVREGASIFSNVYDAMTKAHAKDAYFPANMERKVLGIFIKYDHKFYYCENQSEIDELLNKGGVIKSYVVGNNGYEGAFHPDDMIKSKTLGRMSR